MKNLLTDQIGFLRWLARIILTQYYEEYNANTGNDETYDEDEVKTLSEMTDLWLTNDKPDATEQEVLDFMFDNRRL